MESGLRRPVETAGAGAASALRAPVFIGVFMGRAAQATPILGKTYEMFKQNFILWY